MRNVNKKEVGKRIKRIRQNKGMNLEEFGKLFSVSKSNVSKWESGANLPNSERLHTIAKLNNQTVDELLYGDFEDYIMNLTREIISKFIKNNFLDNHHDNYIHFFKSVYPTFFSTLKRGKEMFDKDVYINKINYLLEIELGLGDRDLDSLTQYAYSKLIDASEIVVEYYNDPLGREKTEDESINNFLNEISKKYSELENFINEYRKKYNLESLGDLNK
ncbi:helix-turn-helix domain-containing protein [Staphylococcus hominis]|uniref:helix-turn-helix domain-containing protein n=1 Tax=Staphylococcus hominis TaxID=1290 RepID=UPI0026DFCB99|nr:helix-turn-helix transcriptional regulator [Staphylococcus hominis]